MTISISDLITDCGTDGDCIKKINELNERFDNNNYEGTIQLINDINNNQYFSNNDNFNNYINDKAKILHNFNKLKSNDLIDF